MSDRYLFVTLNAPSIREEKLLESFNAEVNRYAREGWRVVHFTRATVNSPITVLFERDEA